MNLAPMLLLLLMTTSCSLLHSFNEPDDHQPSGSIDYRLVNKLHENHLLNSKAVDGLWLKIVKCKDMCVPLDLYNMSPCGSCTYIDVEV